MHHDKLQGAVIFTRAACQMYIRNTLLRLHSITMYTVRAIVNATDTIDAIYDDFVKIVNWHVDQIVPLYKVTMRDS